MRDFVFKVNLVAVVHVRAADESAARKVVPTVLGASGTLEIALANQNNAAVDFSAGSIKGERQGSWRKGSTILPITP